MTENIIALSFTFLSTFRALSCCSWLEKSDYFQCFVNWRTPGDAKRKSPPLNASAISAPSRDSSVSHPSTFYLHQSLATAALQSERWIKTLCSRALVHPNIVKSGVWQEIVSNQISSTWRNAMPPTIGKATSFGKQKNSTRVRPAQLAISSRISCGAAGHIRSGH